MDIGGNSSTGLYPTYPFPEGKIFKIKHYFHIAVGVLWGPKITSPSIYSLPSQQPRPEEANHKIAILSRGEGVWREAERVWVIGLYCTDQTGDTFGRPKAILTTATPLQRDPATFHVIYPFLK